jgi:hypothetical protein
MQPQESASSDIQSELIMVLTQGDEDEACRMIANHRAKFANVDLGIPLILGVEHEYYIFTRILLNLHGEKLNASCLGLAMLKAVACGNNSILLLFTDTPSLFNRIDSDTAQKAAGLAYRLAYRNCNFAAQWFICRAQMRRTCPSCAIL